MSELPAEEVEDPDEVAFLRKLARVDDLPTPGEQLRTGDRLARFAIVRRLGTGGMGAVYEAKDETLGRSVALKVMRRSTDDARKRFIQEARAAAAVSHHNVATVHEVGEDDGRAFIVMELIRGRTLREAALGRDEALRVLGDVARGIAAAHEVGVVHRDLKPENVMLGNDGIVKVLDFGIARLATSSTVTGTDVVVGTPQYMSPEQALGIEVDARSDVYSFGVFAYELLTGRRPKPSPPPANISPRIDAVLARCLAAAPADRYADAREVRDALARPAPRGRRQLAIGALGVLGIASVLVAWRLAGSAHVPDRPLDVVGEANPANTAALGPYRAAFQLLRDAMFLEAVQSFERAVELDPAFAAAHLRIGLLKRYFHDPEDARRSYTIAVANRAQLDEHDKLLLHAAEPIVARWPYDYAEARRRLNDALETYPRDAELLFYLMFSFSELGEHASLLPVLDRMEAIDPAAPVVWSSRAFTLLYLGDRRGAREAAIECRRLAPTQGGCAFELQRILDDLGACSELETVLRAWSIASADNRRPPRAIARLLLSEGRPLDAVREHFASSRKLRPERERAEDAVEAEVWIAWATGDFVTYERLLRSVLDQGWNELVALWLVDLLEETDRPADIRALTDKFFALNRGDAPVGTSDLDLYNDRTGSMLAAHHRAGAITRDEFRSRRDRWARSLHDRIGGAFKRGVWAQSYAMPVRTADDAREAVAVMPNDLAPFFWFSYIYGAVGRTLALAGKHAEAMPYLERATKLCYERDPRDYYYLGLAREGVGDTKGACVAYGELLRRWATAKPRSVTLERARDRATRLGCE